MSNPLLPDKANDAVRAEQIRLLYHQGSTIQLLGIVTALVAVSALWKVADHTMLCVWLGIMILTSLIRLNLNLRFARIDANDPAIDKWGNLYIAGTFASGIIWASLSLFFDPAWPAPYQVILFALYTGLVAGAFNTNSSVFIAFPAFYLPLVISLMAVTLKQQNEGFYTLSMLFFIYMILMYISSYKLHTRLTQALELRFVNEQLAAELALSNQKLIQLADIDGLTQIYNRRSLDRCMSAEWNRHYRDQKPLSLLFIDIDYFKQYNDTYGHERGDHCLIEIARILENNAQRSNDLAARFGGEEFAVVLPETEEQDAQKIARRIREDLAQLHIPHASSFVSEWVTMSIGIATMIPQQPDHNDLLFAAADKALYDAKNSGRNCVIQAPNPPLPEILLA